jgi:hypothetical protein
MVELMCNFIYETCESGDRCAEDMDVMEELLDMLVEEGMLPPGKLITGPCCYTLNEWEPEE